MHIRLGFRIHTAINEAEANGVDILQTADGRHFFLSYHLKSVCNKIMTVITRTDRSPRANLGGLSSGATVSAAGTMCLR